MKLIYFSFLYFIFPSSILGSVDVPETIVELSIFDLVKKGPSKYSLPKNYGSQVAQLILKEDKALTSCLDKKNNLKQVVAQININQLGVGKILFESKEGKIKKSIDKIDDCISNHLGNIIYPKHQLKKSVLVKLPLDLKLDIL